MSQTFDVQVGAILLFTELKVSIRDSVSYGGRYVRGKRQLPGENLGPIQITCCYDSGQHRRLWPG